MGVLPYYKVIAAFYIAAFTTMLLLTATYIASSPERFEQFKFCALDKRIVTQFQATIRSLQNLSGSKTSDAIEKAVLILSDQHLITGASMLIVGMARLQSLTQYHYNTVINLAFAATTSHAQTLTFVIWHIEGQKFFRIWRAFVMILSIILLIAIFAPTGSNDWLEDFGLPAICGFKNLGQGFGPPASISLILLYWFLLRQATSALDLLFTNSPTAAILSAFMNKMGFTYLLGILCQLLQRSRKSLAGQLRKHHNAVIELRKDHSPSFWLWTVVLCRATILETILCLVCLWLMFLYALIYGIWQVWSSKAFSLCWMCYQLVASARWVAYTRDLAPWEGMIGNENEWGFGQQLPLLPLFLPALAMLEIVLGKKLFECKIPCMEVTLHRG